MTSKKFKPSGIGKASAATHIISTAEQCDVEAKEKEQDASKLEEQLDELAAALLVLKSTLQQIEEGNSRFLQANKNFEIVLEKYEDIVSQSKDFVKEVTQIGVTSHISDESMKAMGHLLTSHFKVFIETLEGSKSVFSRELRNITDDYLLRQKDVHQAFLADEKQELSSFCKNLTGTISKSGFWCSERVFYRLVYIFMPCLVFTIMMLCLIFAGHIHIG